MEEKELTSPIQLQELKINASGKEIKIEIPKIGSKLGLAKLNALSPDSIPSSVSSVESSSSNKISIQVMPQETPLTRVSQFIHYEGQVNSKKEDMEFAECHIDIIRSESSLEFVNNFVFSLPEKELKLTKSCDKNTVSSIQK